MPEDPRAAGKATRLTRRAFSWKLLAFLVGGALAELVAARRSSARPTSPDAATGSAPEHDPILVGVGGWLVPLPAFLWRPFLSGKMKTLETLAAALTEDQRKLRIAAVLAVGREGRPVSAETLAQQAGRHLDRVREDLSELERRRAFLVLDDTGAVEWAFPVTAARTPHRVTLSSGERLWAA